MFVLFLLLATTVEAVPLRWNVGATQAWSDSNRMVWLPDAFPSGTVDDAACSDPDGGFIRWSNKNDLICRRKEWYGQSSGNLEIPVPEEGMYEADLIFSEYKGTVGKRVMDIYVENKLLYPNVDIVQLANAPTTLLTLTVTMPVTDGSFTLEIRASQGRPTLAGISIKSAGPIPWEVSGSAPRPLGPNGNQLPPTMPRPPPADPFANLNRFPVPAPTNPNMFAFGNQPSPTMPRPPPVNPFANQNRFPAPAPTNPNIFPWPTAPPGPALPFPAPGPANRFPFPFRQPGPAPLPNTFPAIGPQSNTFLANGANLFPEQSTPAPRPAPTWSWPTIPISFLPLKGDTNTNVDNMNVVFDPPPPSPPNPFFPAFPDTTFQQQQGQRSPAPPPPPQPVVPQQAQASQQATTPPTSWRIDLGSFTPYTDGDGNVWEADTLQLNGGMSVDACSHHPFGSLADGELYCKYRAWNSMSTGIMEFPVPQGTYNIKFLMSETHAVLGRRLMDIKVEGITMFTDVDATKEIGDSYGVFTLTVKSNIQDGAVSIEMIAKNCPDMGTDCRPVLAGIEIIPTQRNRRLNQPFVTTTSVSSSALPLSRA